MYVYVYVTSLTPASECSYCILCPVVSSLRVVLSLLPVPLQLVLASCFVAVFLLFCQTGKYTSWHKLKWNLYFNAAPQCVCVCVCVCACVRAYLRACLHARVRSREEECMVSLFLFFSFEVIPQEAVAQSLKYLKHRSTFKTAIVKLTKTMM